LSALTGEILLVLWWQS